MLAKSTRYAYYNLTLNYTPGSMIFFNTPLVWVTLAFSSTTLVNYTTRCVTSDYSFKNNFAQIAHFKIKPLCYSLS